MGRPSRWRSDGRWSDRCPDQVPHTASLEPATPLQDSASRDRLDLPEPCGHLCHLAHVRGHRSALAVCVTPTARERGAIFSERSAARTSVQSRQGVAVVHAGKSQAIIGTVRIKAGLKSGTFSGRCSARRRSSPVRSPVEQGAGAGSDPTPAFLAAPQENSSRIASEPPPEGTLRSFARSSSAGPRHWKPPSRPTSRKEA